MNVITSSTSMRSDKSETSSLETQCLFGEKVKILDHHLDWVYCKLTTDGYCGWIKKISLGHIEKTKYRVIVKNTFIYKNKSKKSDVLIYLPMGSKLDIEDIKSEWAKTCFFVQDKIQIGYLPSSHIVVCENKVKDWVSMAQQLEGIPYRWGGRDTIGIDCSALLQLSYQTYGEMIPRNTSEQVKLKKKIVNNISDLRRGCVVFWKGHVGIMIDKVNCIHANAFHMKTTIEPLLTIMNRTDKKTSIIKMMDFN